MIQDMLGFPGKVTVQADDMALFEKGFKGGIDRPELLKMFSRLVGIRGKYLPE